MHLLGISGSLRSASRNTALLNEAVRLLAPDQYTRADIHLPLYDGDLETAEGAPAGAVTLHRQIAEADAVVIATPEYNKSLPGGLKNALDWVSRLRPNPWADKPVAIMSAAGITGGVRAQYALRHAMTPFAPRILQGPEMMLFTADSAFDDQDRLNDPRRIDTLSALMNALRREVEFGHWKQAQATAAQ